MDVKTINKEEAHNLLVLKAGDIERANRLKEKTDGDLFLDAYECQRLICVTSKFFDRLMELFEPEVTIDDSEMPKRWFMYELYGQEYKIMGMM